MSSPTGWEGILDDGETVLWQGRPNASFVFKARYIFTTLFGLTFAAFALFWMFMARSAGGTIWMFGLIHFSAGIGLVIAPAFYSIWKRRHTWYTLTDRRAFIATDKPFSGRKLKSYPIDSDTTLDYTPGHYSTIYFAHEHRSGKNGTVHTPVGFERIEDGKAVYELIRDIQSGPK